MPKGRKAAGRNNVGDYRHKQAKRKNNPPAGLAPTYARDEGGKTKYEYDPHLDPQLVWAGKAEHTSFDVDVVSLHIHERVSTRAILEAVKKPEPQLALFGNNELPADKQIEFYQHEVGWANRLILGDSLLVMNSMLVKEGMAGKVQCIYIDPPYGIKYASNMRSRTDRRDVKDKDDDLTREPEQIKAYRDTWKLGIHSYLTYLRDRLLLAKDLLHESGSVFVQINDENLHRVRALMDEVFGSDNFCAQVAFRKTTGAGSPMGGTEVVAGVFDLLLWYAKKKGSVKYHQLFQSRSGEGWVNYNYVRTETGEHRVMTQEERDDWGLLPNGAVVYRRDNLTSTSSSGEAADPFEFEGAKYSPYPGGWKTSRIGLRRLLDAERMEAYGTTLSYRRFAKDYPWFRLNNLWEDTATGGYAETKLFVVQTIAKIIERCLLMITDPGDLVFDPTCGSGTTAYCAEKWGRRWVTCDTSRVALQIARQRLMTAKYDYFELQDSERGPASGLRYETVPHIMLESIARDTEIDATAAKYQPEIDSALTALNRLVPSPLKGEGKGRPSPSSSPFAKGRGEKSAWQEWDVPREADKAWDKAAKDAHRAFWDAKRAKRREIDASIQRNAPQETLYDKPFKKLGVVRVTGPFTVEAIPAPAIAEPGGLGTQSQIQGGFGLCPSPVPQFEAQEAQGRVNDKAGDYLSDMINLLKQQGGVLFPKGKKLELASIRPLSIGFLHAEAEAPSPQPSPASGRGRDGVSSPASGRGRDGVSSPASGRGRDGVSSPASGRGRDGVSSPASGRGRDGVSSAASGRGRDGVSSAANGRGGNGVPSPLKGEGKGEGGLRRVAISFGPQFGPVIAMQAHEAIQIAKANAFDILLIAGFSFEAEAQAFVQKAREMVRGLNVQFANIAPDVLVGDLLKTGRASQIFTGFGQPDIGVEPRKGGTFVVKLKGVDIYDPLKGETNSASGEDVAAWFLDCDYDGMTFHICQAFFPGDKDAWEKLQRALKAQIEPEAFEQMRGTESFPFEPGRHKRIAVKVIDYRGNEVMGTRELGAAQKVR